VNGGKLEMMEEKSILKEDRRKKGRIQGRKNRGVE